MVRNLFWEMACAVAAPSNNTTIQRKYNSTQIQQFNTIHFLTFLVLCWRLRLLLAALDRFVSYAGGFDSISHCNSSMEKLVTSAVTFCTIGVCIHALMNGVCSVKERLHKTDLLQINNNKSG